MSRVGELLIDPNDLRSVAEAVTRLIKIVDSTIEFGNPQDPEGSTDLAGSGSPTTHNGELMNIKGSWVELDVTALDTPIICNHNLAAPVFNNEVNVQWWDTRLIHSGVAANAASTISYNHEAGDLINENQIELRFYASGARTVDADNPIMVTLFFITANRRPTAATMIADDEPPPGFSESQTASLSDPSFESGSFYDSDDAPSGWWDKQVTDATALDPPPPDVHGGWRSTGAFIEADGARAAYAGADATTTLPALAVNQEIELYSDLIDMMIGSVVPLWVDAGRIFVNIQLAIARRPLTPDSPDEARIGIGWYDGSNNLISAQTSAVIGTAAGLGETYTDFDFDFTAPVGARKYRVRCIAIRRGPHDFPQIQFDHCRLVVYGTN